MISLFYRLLHWLWRKHGRCPLCVAEWRREARLRWRVISNTDTAVDPSVAAHLEKLEAQRIARARVGNERP